MYWLSIYLLFSSALGSIAASIQNRVMDSCAAVALPFPDLFGAEFTSLSAFSVMNYSVDLRQMDNHAPVNITGLNFCNVSIQYTHPGQNDDIHVEVWLPFESWNGRFMGTGGGAYATGLGALSLAYAVSLGYSAASSDGGHILNYEDPSSWALSSPGNVNWVLLQDFAAVALDDLTTIGKAITTAYYGSPPSYSYWNGCSTGGRQGLMMAQRYPSQYDGILATAPGIYWDSFLVTGVWAQLVMNELGTYQLKFLRSATDMIRDLSATVRIRSNHGGCYDGLRRPGWCDRWNYRGSWSL